MSAVFGVYPDKKALKVLVPVLRRVIKNRKVRDLCEGRGLLPGDVASALGRARAT